LLRFPIATFQFSVVITCHNQRNFIADAVDSALSQIHLSREVIVVDDASTDGSDSILKSYGDRIRLVLLERNQGAPTARNAGTAIARGDYLVYLDGDDLLKSWALIVYHQIIQARKPVLILSSLTLFQGAVPEYREANPPSQIRFVSYGNWVEKDRPFRSSASALIVKRQAFETIGGWTKEVWPFEDQYLAAELAYSGRAIQVLDPVTVLYRLHSTSAMHDVPRLIAGCYRFVSAWESNKRFIGKERSLSRLALIGGPALWAVKKAFRGGHRVEALRLFKRVWPWVAVAVFLRIRSLVFGRRPTQTISVPFSPLPAIGCAVREDSGS
jgi:glycosyltransferase involved in cell wall biosynthesis